MKKALLKFLWIYATYAILFLLMKPVFLLIYHSLIDASPSEWLAVMLHGLPMDLSVAGYLTILPGLAIAGELITKARWLNAAMDIYIGLTAIIVAVIHCLDLGLYGTWGFRLDMTPVFYFTTSPEAAMASLQWWHWLTGLTGIAATWGCLWALYCLTARRIQVQPATGTRRRIWQPTAMVVTTALLIIPIRGSLTVSTMNLSRAYFSTDQRLNHAAINPVFSLLYSATHQDNFDAQYDFMPDDEAAAIVEELFFAGNRRTKETSDSTAMALLSTDRPDIVMVILESFSAHLLPQLGGEDIATGLDSIARESILFTNFYASSFRTDRGLAAILSSFPAPPSTSLLKYVDKFENLPSLPSLLREQGYDAAYYYGGDTNFTNMQAYLVSSGFDPIVSDKDFPIADRASKWGAHDGIVFDRALADIQAASTDRRRTTPRLTVVQTSSSHEPFEVPYSNPRFADNPRKNAFAYTDSCLTHFVNALRYLPNYDKTLIVIVPDHYGCWPENIADPISRHRIPLVLTGGALTTRQQRIDKLASQTDIGATILAMMGLPSTPLEYSRDIFSTSTPPIAYFSEPSLIGIITDRDTIVANPDADPDLPTSARAILRDIYSTLGKL